MSSFVKMHGLGNDFVIFDARHTPLDLTAEQIRVLSAQRTGIGCDQLVVMRPSNKADIFMQIFNADGGEVDACGNASRCVGQLMMDELGQDNAVIETKAGILNVTRAASGITVNMGEPKLEWQEIPLSKGVDTLHLGISEGPLKDPVAVSMGNPHAVFFVQDIASIPLEEVGPKLEHHPLFPERANIGVAQIEDQQTIRLRVWERGAGETLACGTGACAALVAAVRRNLADRLAGVHLPGGALQIEWRGSDNHVLMTGPVETSFTGEVAII